MDEQEQQNVVNEEQQEPQVFTEKETYFSYLRKVKNRLVTFFIVAALLIIGAIIAFNFIISGFTGFFFDSAEKLQEKITDVDVPEEEIAGTSNWNKYINLNAGFSILYPPDYIVKENPDGVAIVGLSHKDGPIEAAGLKIYSTETEFNSFYEYKEDLITNFEKRLEKNDIDLSKFNYSFKDEIINNSIALLHKRDFYGLLGNVYDMDVWIDDGTVLMFSSEDDNEILDKIYHSFKIIELQASIDTSNWKKYRNEEYGFEIKIPSDWLVNDAELIFNDIVVPLSFLSSDFVTRIKECENEPCMSPVPGAIYFSPQLGDKNGIISEKVKIEINKKIFQFYISSGLVAHLNYEIPNNINNYHFTTWNNPDNKIILEQILSTFKFIDARYIRDENRVKDIRKFQLALELYFDFYDTYPLTLNNLVEYSLPSLPVDPLDGTQYFYVRISSDSYHIGVNLENDDFVILENDADYESQINGNDSNGCNQEPDRFCLDAASPYII